MTVTKKSIDRVRVMLRRMDEQEKYAQFHYGNVVPRSTRAVSVKDAEAIREMLQFVSSKVTKE